MDRQQLPLGRRARWQYRLLRLLVVPTLHLLFRLRVVGRNNIPASGRYVLVANHLNWIDAPAILLAFPIEPRVNFLADAEFARVRGLQWFVARQIGGLILCDRQDHSHPGVRNEVRSCLADCGPVGVFAEGQYGEREGELMRFRPGFAHFALDSGVPVLPVAVSGSRSLWLRKEVTTIIESPIPTEGHTLESLVAATRAQVQALLPAYEEPRGFKLLRGPLSRAFS